MKIDIRLIWSLCLVFLLGCAGATPAPTTAVSTPPSVTSSKTLRLIATSPFAGLDGAIKRFNAQTGNDVRMEIVSSVDLRLRLQDCNSPIDAVGASDTLGLTLGDKCSLVKYRESAMHSPIVLGVKPSKARELNWLGTDISVRQVSDAVKSQQLHYAMPSASQSNVGASALFGFIQALKPSGNPATEQDLQDESLKKELTDLFSGLNQSSTSALELKKFVQAHYDEYQATFNYEAFILQNNKELKEGQEPFQIFYLKDALVTADIPLAFVDHGNQATKDLFLSFKNFILQDARGELSAQGWRTGLLGSGFSAEDKAKYAAWGYKEDPAGAPFYFPRSEVLLQVMTAFQVGFRPPSCLGWVLDTSGSMGTSLLNGNIQDAVVDGKKMYRIEALKQSMQPVVDPGLAEKFLLQATVKDVNTVVPFSDGVITNWSTNIWQVQGNDKAKLTALWNKINGLSAGGGTGLYGAVIFALTQLKATITPECRAAIVVLTDGAPSIGAGYNTFKDLQTAYINSGLNIPLYAIALGEANMGILTELTSLNPRGQVFDGKTTDLKTIFRTIRGQS